MIVCIQRSCDEGEQRLHLKEFEESRSGNKKQQRGKKEKETEGRNIGLRSKKRGDCRGKEG